MWRRGAAAYVVKAVVTICVLEVGAAGYYVIVVEVAGSVRVRGVQLCVVFVYHICYTHQDIHLITALCMAPIIIYDDPIFIVLPKDSFM